MDMGSADRRPTCSVAGSPRIHRLPSRSRPRRAYAAAGRDRAAVRARRDELRAAVADRDTDPRVRIAALGRARAQRHRVPTPAGPGPTAPADPDAAVRRRAAELAPRLGDPAAAAAPRAPRRRRAAGARGRVLGGGRGGVADGRTGAVVAAVVGGRGASPIRSSARPRSPRSARSAIRPGSAGGARRLRGPPGGPPARRARAGGRSTGPRWRPRWRRRSRIPTGRPVRRPRTSRSPPTDRRRSHGPGPTTGRSQAFHPTTTRRSSADVHTRRVTSWVQHLDPRVPHLVTGTLASIPTLDGVLHLGPVPLHMYGLHDRGWRAGAVVGRPRRYVREGIRRPRENKAGREAFDRVVCWAVIVGLIGARLYDVMTHYQLFEGNWGRTIRSGRAGSRSGPRSWAGDRAVDRLPASRDELRRLRPLIVPGIAFAQAYGGGGTACNQELFGGPSGCRGRSRSTPCTDTGYGDGDVQPTFLYESLWCLALGRALLWVDHRFQLVRGQLIALYAAGLHHVPRW